MSITRTEPTDWRPLIAALAIFGIPYALVAAAVWLFADGYQAPEPAPAVVVEPLPVDYAPSLWGLAAVEARPVAVELEAAVVAEIGTAALVAPGRATHYGVGYETGESCGHPGTPCGLGCTGEPYRSGDASIVAVGAVLNAVAPCGTPIQVCGAAGCIDGVRVDSCGGCTGYWVDLSEAGIESVCGVGAGSCDVTIAVN
jgi:hypothetical protein